MKYFNLYTLEGAALLIMVTSTFIGPLPSPSEVFLKDGVAPNQGDVWINISGKSQQVPLVVDVEHIKTIPNVLCRIMGLPGEPKALPPSVYAKEHSSFLVFSSCNGHEASLHECSHSVFINLGRKYSFTIGGYFSYKYQLLRITCGLPSAEVVYFNHTRPCYYTMEMETDPWIKLSMKRTAFIHTIIMHKNNTELNDSMPTVVVKDSRSGNAVNCDVTVSTALRKTLACKMEFKTDVIMIAIENRKNRTSLLPKACKMDIKVFTFDSFKDAHGVTFQQCRTKPRKTSFLKASIQSDENPNNYSVIPTFDFFYIKSQPGQAKRLRGYLMVYVQGDYNIAASCKEECEVWTRREKEADVDDEWTAEELIIKLEFATKDKIYGSKGLGQSKKVRFSKCHLYHMEMLTRDSKGGYGSIGIKYPGLHYLDWELFPVHLLYWKKPGFRRLAFEITNNINTILQTGSKIVVKAKYKFCCSGLICPSCPIILTLNLLGKSVMVNRSLQMDCQEYDFVYENDVNVEPGDYKLEIVYSFEEDIISSKHRRMIMRSLKVEKGDESYNDSYPCSIGHLSCSDGKCIYQDKLCDSRNDCKNGNDERHCGVKCDSEQCYDGTCPSCSSKTSCEEGSSRFLKCVILGHCLAGRKTCVKQTSSDSQCGQNLKGLCGFENGPCNFDMQHMQHINSSLQWDFMFPTSNDKYQDYDHTTLTQNGIYVILKPSDDVRNGYGKLTMNWTQSTATCLQFWYVISDQTNSSTLEVVFENVTITKRIWRATELKTKEWTFGQVEIPSNSIGKFILIGRVDNSSIALDDLNFIEGGCSTIVNQSNPSCYFDDDDVCGWSKDDAWTFELDRMSKQYPLQESRDAYLTLSQSLDRPSTVCSPVIHPRSQGWQCFRFWFYSGGFQDMTNLSVSFQTEQSLNEVWKYHGITNKWNFIQIDISRHATLKIIISAMVHSLGAAKLAIDDLTFLKEKCKGIPVLGSACHEYKTVDSHDRRMPNDTFFGLNTWYRITGAGGKELEFQNACYSIFKQQHRWLEDCTLPSVEQGVVERTTKLTDRKGYCFLFTRKVKIRNCNGYYVYAFPEGFGPKFFPRRLCSVYKNEVKGLNVQKEWKDWRNRLNQSQWIITKHDQHPIIQQSIKGETRGKSLPDDRDYGLLLNGSASLRVQTKGSLNAMTLCLWISINDSSLVTLSMVIKNAGVNESGVSLDRIASIIRNGFERWTHICVSWKSDFGVLQVYIDGTAKNHKLGVLDTEQLLSTTITITFESNQTNALLKFSRLNIWESVLTEYEIFYMSYECGGENGTHLKWNEYRNNMTAVSDNPVMEYKSACVGKQANVLSVHKQSTKLKNVAEFVSPRYERSSVSPGRCLKFRYKLWGPGARSIKLYQKLDNNELPRRPVWMDDDNGTSTWREGQVTLTAVTGYKLIIEGETTDKPALLSIGALYTTEGYCIIKPTTADRACNEVLTDSTGTIMSPYYPGYYSSKANCTWTIKAKKGHVIRLEIKTFELEMSPRCSADFVEVYDGENTQSFRIGRYCGVRYPPIIQSSFNGLFVMFVSNEKTIRNGFLAKYQVKRDKQDRNCVSDCPTDCECRRSRSNRSDGIIISSQQLRSVPERIPKQATAILFSGSEIFLIRNKAFSNLQDLFYVDLSFNKILYIERRSFVNLPSLEGLRLNRNFLQRIDSNMLEGLPKLVTLDLGQNLISTICSTIFAKFPNLIVLSLRSNIIKHLDRESFRNNSQLSHLYLHDNEIQEIPPGLFGHQQNLKVLKLHSNRLLKLNKSCFEGLTRLETLTLDNNTIKEPSVQQDVFKPLINLKYLSLDSFILCCYAKKSIPGLKECQSPGNGFSSCDDMLKSVVIQSVIWIQGVFAAFGNLAVILWWFVDAKQKDKKRTKRKTDTQSFLLSNLALADLLMGIYLLFIAIQHTLWKGEYFKHDVEWRTGILCQIAGGIATLSSEVSVMVLVVITADRVNSILFEFSARRLNLKVARLICLFIWIIGFIISFVPLFIPGYFKDQASGFSFYGRSTVCLPLQLSSDRPAGWEYSIAVFNAFNGAAFIFIFFAYIAIFVKVKRSGKRVRSSKISSPSLGRRLIFIILTDFCCWMPVVVLGVISLTGNVNDPTGQIYAWTAVLVLPINSSINPILYTFSTPQVTKRLQSMRNKWQNRKVNCKDSNKAEEQSIPCSEPGRSPQQQSEQITQGALQRMDLDKAVTTAI